MISAFKHIRLSGQNLIPIQGVSYDGSNLLRLSLGNSGLAYYSELTGISGHLQNLIDIADNDVTRINNLSGAVALAGANGISIGVDTNTNTITISGDTNSLNNLITSLSGSLNQTGANLEAKITSLSGSLNQTGVNLTNTISSLSGALNATGEHIYANFIRKATQQSFTLNVPQNIDTTGILFPVAFSSTPSTVNVTLEIPGDVMYMTAIKNKTNAGFTAEFSDLILEAGVKLNTFASDNT
jgi:hypothetical protein